MSFYQLFYIMSVGDKLSLLLIWFAILSSTFSVFVSSELKKASNEAQVEIKGLTEQKLEDLTKEELIKKLKEK